MINFETEDDEKRITFLLEVRIVCLVLAHVNIPIIGSVAEIISLTSLTSTNWTNK
jgi:hypothetical protein